jgi:hypothetical protein
MCEADDAQVLKGTTSVIRLSAYDARAGAPDGPRDGGATGLPRRSPATAPAARRVGARRGQTSRDLPKPALPLARGLPEHAGMNPVEWQNALAFGVTS